ncbi:hypothetical protein TWF696_009615 [Orbilia brochopaga]|uniref:Uncharacterized protein n=1 Tax=Orbilia brochopaga TaxID=3140254 RepID=A0AAV9UBT7_9PEZI
MAMKVGHVYKTAFNSVLGMFGYLRMGQGLSGAPHTYARLQDFVTGHIPARRGEPAISGGTALGAFAHFFDDHLGANVSPAAQASFLHNSYFPRISWAQLTLSPSRVNLPATQVKLPTSTQ